MNCVQCTVCVLHCYDDMREREEKREHERKSVVHLMSGSDPCKRRRDRNKGQLLSNLKQMFLGAFLETRGLSALTSHLNSFKAFPFSSL